MSYLTDEKRRDKVNEKADIIQEWLEWIEEQYADLLSRASETGSLSGFDDLPTTRPCEHRVAWRKGKLCLACDNTGWRPATRKEREDGLARDPYSFELPKSQVKVTQSDSARRAQEASRLDSIIATLDRNAKVREGRDVLEDKDVRQFRIVCHRPAQAKLVIAALHRLQHYGFDLFLDRREMCLVVAILIGKKLSPPRAQAA